VKRVPSWEAGLGVRVRRGAQGTWYRFHHLRERGGSRRQTLTETLDGLP
jgi:hypothetical protein